MVAASDIRDCIKGLNGKGVTPTCGELADVLARRFNQEIGVADLQDKLDEMEAHGMSIKNGSGYSVNPGCKL